MEVASSVRRVYMYVVYLDYTGGSKDPEKGISSQLFALIHPLLAYRQIISIEYLNINYKNVIV